MSSRFRLTPPAEPPPLPTGALLAAAPRRPGELHDVVHLGDAAEAFAARATRAGVGFDVAATLLIEFSCVTADLAKAGSPTLRPPRAGAPDEYLSAAEAGYLRSLTLRREHEVPPRRSAAVPIRMLRRITPSLIAASAGADLEDAIAWEVGAVVAGRTMSEFALLTVTQALLGI